MHADVVIILKGLAVRVDGLHGDHGCPQSIDPLVRRAAGMRRAPFVAHHLDQTSVRGAAHTELALFLSAGLVRHDRHVHVVERSQADQLGLAPQEFERTLAPQPQAVLHLHILLGRNGHQRDVAI